MRILYAFSLKINDPKKYYVTMIISNHGTCGNDADETLFDLVVISIAFGTNNAVFFLVTDVMLK